MASLGRLTLRINFGTRHFEYFRSAWCEGNVSRTVLYTQATPPNTILLKIFELYKNGEIPSSDYFSAHEIHITSVVAFGQQLKSVSL